MRPYVVRLARYTSKAKAEEKHAQERRMREAMDSNGRKPFVPQVRPPHRCGTSMGLPLARFGLGATSYSHAHTRWLGGADYTSVAGYEANAI